MKRIVAWSLAGASLLVVGAAAAHSFGTVYNLPVPFWMYAYGASATLIVSFVIVAYFAAAPRQVTAARPSVAASAARRIKGRLSPAVVTTLRCLSAGLLLLCIASGLIGTPNTYVNFNMTFFWIVFALGFLYVSALVGDFYSVVNPWRVVCDAIAWAMPALLRVRARYPAWLGFYPALVLYIAFIWLELFGRTQPMSLAVVLLAYTVINLLGAAIVGRDNWFRYGEFFAVMFDLTGRLAPISYTPTNDGGCAIRVRKVFAGLREAPPQQMSLLLFILFMLSSTAYDGLHETLPFVTIFWRDLYPFLTAGSTKPYVVTVNYYYYWQWTMLVVLLFLYLVVYLLFVALGKALARSRHGFGYLAGAFMYSLVPIAFVYNVTHYFTLLASQGIQILRLVSDPFGFGWNLLGTARWVLDPLIIDAGAIWHTQVSLIIAGHILGVYLAHLEALEAFAGTRRAVLSQLPMLFLMVLFTTAGLWILSLPIAAGQVLRPPGS